MLIYVLDDDVLETLFWREAAKPKGHYVLGFQKALDFRQAVMERAPDVAVIDLIMPNETGDEVCKWMRACYPDVKVVVCTGAEGDKYKILAEQCGASYMSKTIPHRDRMEALLCR